MATGTGYREKKKVEEAKGEGVEGDIEDEG